MGGVAVELVHFASLYHDDVIDEATIRRNVESVNSRFGNLVRDRRGRLPARPQRRHHQASLGTEIRGAPHRRPGRLCQGQVTEVRSAFQVHRSREDYVTTINGKTAALTASSCRIGALTGSLPRPRRSRPPPSSGAASAWCSRSVTTSSTSPPPTGQLQKPAGQDLAEGIYTLPALVALGDPDAGPDLHALLGQPLAQPEHDKARAIVMSSDRHRRRR